MSLITSKLKNLASRAKEKVQGFDKISVPFTIFTTLYSPLKEENTLTTQQRHVAEKQRLKYYLENEDYKGTYTFMNDNFLIAKNKPGLIDYNWINLQNDYISNLPKKDILTCCGYSFTGDVIINSYIQKTFDISKIIKTLTVKKVSKKVDRYRGEKWKTHLFPFFPQMVDIILQDNTYNYINYMKLITTAKSIDKITWYDIFDLYISDLQRIISDAPALTKEITVWRGAKTKRMYNYKETTNDIYYKTTQFHSTTLSVPIAVDFTGISINGKGCCLAQIIVLKGCHILLMIGFSYVPEEYEILINLGNNFLIKESKLLQFDNFFNKIMSTKQILV